MESQLFGPDVSDTPPEAIEEVGDTIEVWSRQFVNSWVFLAHQRPSALKELKELLACHTETLNAGGSLTASGTIAGGAPSAASVVVDSPSQHGAAPTVKRSIKALVDLTLGDRVDRRLLEPALRVQLDVAVRDFLLCYPPAGAADRVRRSELVKQDPRFRKQVVIPGAAEEASQ